MCEESYRLSLLKAASGKKVQYIRMPELLDELSIARSGGTLKKVLESYKKKDLLILDEWLIRPLPPQESYDMLEIVEARCHKSTIFCTQYESEGWYTRIDPNPESDSPVSEAIMDRIIHNAYEVLVDGRVSMRCNPIGKPFVSDVPAGTDTAGKPAKDDGTVKTSYNCTWTPAATHFALR